MAATARATPRPPSPAGRWPVTVAALFLIYLVGAVFWPVILQRFPFVDLDVPIQIEDNPYIRGLSWENLRHIFTAPCISNYYPVRTLTYAIDYQLWGGLNPTGFKLTNIALHLGNVLLVFWLALRLLRPETGVGPWRRAWWDVAVAAWAGGLFAVHPLVVEPVVWAIGREELLMTLGILGAVHCHLTACRLDPRRGPTRRVVACHLGVALGGAVACLSNGVGAIVPFLILAWDLLTLPRPRWKKILIGTAPLWAMAVATVLIKRGISDRHLASTFPDFLGSEQLRLIPNIYAMNLKAFFWPSQLAVDYGSLLPPSFLHAGVILGSVAIVLTLGLLWMVRRRTLVLFGLLWFGLALGPTSQVLPNHIDRADRFLYLPLVGLVLAATMALGQWGHRPRTVTAGPPSARPPAGAGAPRQDRPVRWVSRGPVVALAAAAGLLLLLVWRTADQLQTWRGSLALWANCVRVAPNNAIAHGALADNLAQRGHYPEAFSHFRRAVELNPAQGTPVHNFALWLTTCPDPRFRDYELAIRVVERACQLSAGRDPRLPHIRAVVYNNVATAMERNGQFQTALDLYRRALQADPQHTQVLHNLALFLATCPEVALRDPEEALRLAKQARRITGPEDLTGWMILGAAYAAAGQFDQAVRTVRTAIRWARRVGDPEDVAELQRQRKLYQKRMPFRPPDSPRTAR